jgi:hypothetical protein
LELCESPVSNLELDSTRGSPEQEDGVFIPFLPRFGDRRLEGARVAGLPWCVRDEPDGLRGWHSGANGEIEMASRHRWKVRETIAANSGCFGEPAEVDYQAVDWTWLLQCLGVRCGAGGAAKAANRALLYSSAAIDGIEKERHTGSTGYVKTATLFEGS